MNRVSFLLVALAAFGCGSGNTQSTEVRDGAGGSGAGAGGSMSTGGSGAGAGGSMSTGGGGPAAGGAGEDGGATTFDPACGPVLREPRCLTGDWCWDAPSLLGGDLFDIDGTADGTAVWAVGAHGSAFRYCSGGWVPMETGVEARLFSVYAPSPDFALAVGEAGTVIEWNGTSWQKLPPPTSATLYAVWGTSPRNVWLGAAALTTSVPNLFRFDGTSITPVGSTGSSIRAIGGRSAVDVYAAGNAGFAPTVAHWDGKTWSQTYFNAGVDAGMVRKLILGPKKRMFAMFEGYSSGAVLVDDSAEWRLVYENFRTRSTGLFLDDAGIPSVVDATEDPLSPALVSKTDTQDRWTKTSDTLPVYPRDVWTGAGKYFAVGEGGALLQRGSAGVWAQVPARAAILGTPIYLGGPSETNAYLVTEHDIYHRDANGWHALPPRSINPISVATTSPEGVLYIGSQDRTTQVITFTSFDGTGWTDLRKPSDLGTQLFVFGPDNVWLAGSSNVRFFDGVKWFDIVSDAGCDYHADALATFRVGPDGKVWGTGRDQVAVFDGPATCTIYQRAYEENASSIVGIGWANGKPWAVTQRGELYVAEGTALTKVALPVAPPAAAGTSPGPVKSMTSIDAKLVYLQYEGEYSSNPDEQTSTIVTVDAATTPPTLTRAPVPTAGVWWPLDATHTFIATHGGVLRRAR